MFGFFGFSWQILVAIALMVIPSLLKRVDKKFPNSAALFQIIPGGVPSIVVMSFIGTAFSNWANSLPLLAADKSKTIVVICSLPGFVISLLKLFGRSPKPGDVRFYRRDSMKIIYRTFGPIMLFIASLITIGVI
jgi:carbon starvation protein CstA